MKNIFEIMKEYGLEVPEDKKKNFEKAVLENYKTVTDYDNQTKKLESADATIQANDTAMKELKKQLEGFKDVDVTALNQRITDLEAEKATIKKEYDDKIAERDFEDCTNAVIAKYKGKNAKAIKALLDLDTLKTSKNQNEDLEKAVQALTEAEDSKMLFGESEPQNIGSGNPIGTVNKMGDQSGDAAMRAAMGLPPISEQK